MHSNSTDLGQFDIRNFADRLEPTKTKGKYICPKCGGSNLSINQETGAYSCFNGCQCKDIRDTVAPLDQFKNVLPFSQPNKKKKARKLPPPPQGKFSLVQSISKIEDKPQAISDHDSKLGETKKTIYPYSSTDTEAGELNQWVQRIEYADANKPKGYAKQFYQYHRAKAGEDYKGKSHAEGQTIPSKGEDKWQPYRYQAIIESLQAHPDDIAVLLWLEGESNIWYAVGIGLEAVTLQGSSWSVPVISEALEDFKQASQNIIHLYLADNDKAGVEKGEKFLDACAEVNVSGLLIGCGTLGNIADKGDIQELLETMSAEQLIELLNQQVREYQAKYQASDTNDDDSDGGDNGTKIYFTQNVIANIIAENYRDKLAWNVQEREWYHYSAQIEGIWSKEPEEYIWQLVMAESEPLCDPKKGYTANFVAGVIKHLKSHLAVREWDELESFIPLLNGVLEPETKILSPHAPGYRLTWCLPYEYNPLATCTPIQEWLLETVSGDLAQVELLRAYLGATVLGRTDLQRFLELTGPGGSGKSTYIRLAMALVGVRNTHSTTLQKLEHSRFETASIQGKRLVVVTDSERYAGNVSVLKALTGQDALPYEVKFKQSSGGYSPKAMVIVAGNEVIQSADYTSGLGRRRLPVNFKNEVPEDARRNLIEFVGNELKGDFMAYMPGLLNWVLDLSPQDVTNYVVKTSVFVPTLARIKAVTLCQTNPIADWADLHLVLRAKWRQSVGVAQRDKDRETPFYYLNILTSLYASYAEFCAGSNNKPLGCMRFVKLLEDLFKSQLKIPGVYHSRDRQGGYFLGIKIRVETDSDPCLISGNRPPSSPPPPNPPNPPDTPPEPPNNPPGDNYPTLLPELDNTSVLLNVTDCYGLVTAQTLGSDTCDGCEGLFENSLHNSANLKNETQIEFEVDRKYEGVDLASHPSQEATPLADTSVEVSQASVTEASSVSPSLDVEPQLPKLIAVGDRVASSNPTEAAYNWHGEVIEICENLVGQKVAKVRWQERKGMRGGGVLTAKVETLRLVP